MSEVAVQFRVLFTGTGTGTVVSSSPSGLSGSSPGPTPYEGLSFNTPGPWTVQFTAIADPGSVFVGWTAVNDNAFPPAISPGASANNPETFTHDNVDDTYTITAQFDIAPCPTITLDDSGPFNLFLDEPMEPITLIPQGGTGPYTFNIDPNWDACPGGLCPGATLPPGLTIGANSGIISGTPTAGSPCQYVPVVITDYYGCVEVICIELIVAARPAPICHLLTPCPTEVDQVPITVTNDLTIYVGQVVQILGRCFTVSVAPNCNGAVTLNNPVITVFADCCECNPPTCFELEDCSLQTPLLTYSFLAPGPGIDLSQYVGQVIKICDFSANLTLLTDPQVVHSCPPFPPATLGFITQITGSTTGFFYEEATGNILPYAAAVAPGTPYAVGMGACFIGPTNIPSTTTAAPRWSIQYFLGSTAVTSIIPYDTYMSLGFLQYMLDNAILDPKITITLSFGATGLDAAFHTDYSTTEDTFTGVMYINDNSALPQTVTEDLTGSCICYNVRDIGACCTATPPVFTGIIDSVWPDCICCDPPPGTEPEPYQQVIPEIDKGTYKIIESQCDIDANKNFANAMYDIFKTDAYGMESCCPRNFNQIWIQKELSDLSKTNCS